MSDMPTEGQCPEIDELARLRALETSLHRRQIHPDYEYTFTETGRKSGDSKIPEGYGWMPNNHIFGDRNWERLDFVEVEYWMRLKTDALHDDRLAQDLPEIKLPKVKLAEYLAVLSKVAGPARVVRRKEQIANLSEGNGVYIYQPPDIDHTGTLELALPIDPATTYFGIQLSGPLRILTDIERPQENTWVCTTRGSGEWSNWTRWYNYIALPVNLYELKAILNAFAR